MIKYQFETNSSYFQNAYCGTVRIGFIERNRFGSWRWSMSLRENFGKEDDEEAAKESLEKAFKHWCECAGLEFNNGGKS